MANTLIAYHGDPNEKAAILAQLAAHRMADELVKGRYWEHGKGCAIGCTIHSDQHSEYEPRFGVPKILARLEDCLFEGLPNGTARAWPERFMDAITPGADLMMVWPRFAHWLLTEEIPKHTKNEQSLNSLAEVGALYREWIDGAKPIAKRWLSARRNADADADADADAAYYAANAANAAAYAANAAAYAYAAAAAAANAANAAYAAAAANAANAAYAARQGSYVRQADKLIELLQAAPIKEAA